MSELLLELTIKGSQNEFRPRNEVAGRVHLHHSAGGWQAVHADLILFWKTQGKGTMDEGVAGCLNLAKAKQQMPPTFERDFALRLPDLPWTYYGHNIKIHWYVGIYVMGKAADGGKVDQEVVLPLLVHPDPELLREKFLSQFERFD